MTLRARQAFIGAGANLGDRAAALRGAIDRLRASPGVMTVEPSSLYETSPVGVRDQPMFLNLVAGVETNLSPEQLLTLLLAIEQAFGRARTERWGPRTLDLDLLAFEDETRATSSLQLPHPRMLDRKFVVAPLQELLARQRFQRPCWAALNACLASATPEGQVSRLG